MITKIKKDKMDYYNSIEVSQTINLKIDNEFLKQLTERQGSVIAKSDGYFPTKIKRLEAMKT